MRLANLFSVRQIAAFVLCFAALPFFVAAHKALQTLRPVIKRCRACGAHYQRVAWQKLAYLGLMDDGFGGHRLELRNCACGSTLSLPVG